ncbi:hypothetical protein [Amycolatopsis sp. NPDC050768]|uniref:hypothetical protein n=1 Tax=Amycolatopsis sp. NPDC050768 TaxID=3154839 RepID=UPI0033F42B09
MEAETDSVASRLCPRVHRAMPMPMPMPEKNVTFHLGERNLVLSNLDKPLYCKRFKGRPLDDPDERRRSCAGTCWC